VFVLIIVCVIEVISQGQIPAKTFPKGLNRQAHNSLLAQPACQPASTRNYIFAQIVVMALLLCSSPQTCRTPVGDHHMMSLILCVCD
jgi:hypothetical protein